MIGKSRTIAADGTCGYADAEADAHADPDADCRLIVVADLSVRVQDEPGAAVPP